jgi:hypothetical membrane protein
MKRLFKILLFIVSFVAVDRCLGIVINEGLNRYFGLNQYSDVLFIGHSHLMLAVDKSGFEKQTSSKVSKYCREGVNVADRYEMVKQYLASPYSDSLKVVFYGVDQFMFTGAGLSQNSYKLFYPFIDDRTMNNYIRESTDAYDYWLHKLICSTRYSDALLNSSIRGWLKNWNNYKIGQMDVEALKQQIMEGKQRHIHFEQELIDIFEKTLDLITERGIRVILVNTPIAKPLNEYEPYEYGKIIDYFHSLAENPLIYYWDFNPEYSDNYELLFDPIHLNVKGQIVISEKLVENFNSFSIL